jgi:thiamine biosynthesis lipoprotein
MSNVHSENVWSTVVTIESDLHGFSYQRQIEFLHLVDRIFSAFIPESEVSKLRAGVIHIEKCSQMLQEVWEECLLAKEITDGAFDPWAVEGGFDPSGYVKGWAADQICNQLEAVGAKHIQVNAGGDIALRGGSTLHAPWQIGVAHPENTDLVSKIYSISDGAIATSGTYERGNHIIDPQTKSIAVGSRSATVVGENAGLADALATALIVAGRDGADWFSKHELANYSCWVVDRHEDSLWEISRD